MVVGEEAPRSLHTWLGLPHHGSPLTVSLYLYFQLMVVEPTSLIEGEKPCGSPEVFVWILTWHVQVVVEPTSLVGGGEARWQLQVKVKVVVVLVVVPKLGLCLTKHEHMSIRHGLNNADSDDEGKRNVAMWHQCHRHDSSNKSQIF